MLVIEMIEELFGLQSRWYPNSAGPFKRSRALYGGLLGEGAPQKPKETKGKEKRTPTLEDEGSTMWCSRSLDTNTCPGSKTGASWV
ncbi:hypothetical protein DSO57_1028324 [Entomophthora muscae]|uniref:Uncharacterized protein n=1 Tax=Entomophthora muscae TaxID=34485 RepID=A0ACC2SQN6_9FUNG|nr:hypothetical protein DSO57_1028324 [Entomophthora muscae]